MSVSLNKTLQIVWDRTHYQDGSELSAADAEAFKWERINKLKTMWEENKTTGNLVLVIDDTTTLRFFTDEAAAQEYIDFITALAVTRSLNPPVCTIIDGVTANNLEQALADRSARATEPDLPDGSNPTAYGNAL